ncbi:hypothetical protein N7486_010137 [Penicillium sp. IBT 16267x]|nr:hypothetical protein N7486_010137 [Penicillium sp. IBT 16267x]
MSTDSLQEMNNKALGTTARNFPVVTLPRRSGSAHWNSRSLVGRLAQDYIREHTALKNPGTSEQ